VPEQHLAAIRRLSAAGGLAVRVSTSADPARATRGAVSVIDNTVDTTTGTVRLKATLDNRDALLWPGQFVNVVLTLDTLANAVVVPVEAVQPSQQGPVVFVVKSDGAAEARPVVTGPTIAGKTVLEKGVAAGETVVTDGQLQLFPGARVRPVEQANPNAAETK
jgi:multidrug efflux system membrane fusion protein